MSTAQQAFVVSLDSKHASAGEVGRKAANLAILMHGVDGVAIPPGFVITTAAYRAFLDANGLGPRIGAIYYSPSSDDATAAESASSAIRALIEQAPVPADVERVVLEAYAQLASSHPERAGPLSVAVRSSATAEDLPTASFAGQQETLLNVRGDEMLLAAVKRCWSSVWTSRAMQYRAKRAIDSASVAQAVLVQEMVAPEIAGVLFTVDPADRASGAVVINAAWGLGDAVVAGRVTPDTIVVDRRTRAIQRTETAFKAVMTVPAEHGTIDVPVMADLRRALALSPSQAVALALVGLSIEAHFDAPQDIEWAIAGDSIWILQARPITGLRDEPDTATLGDDDWPTQEERPGNTFDLWTLANVAELWPNPVSPMVASTVPLIIGSAVRYALNGVDSRLLDKIQWARRFYGRIYYNEGALRHLLSSELGLPASLFNRGRGHWAGYGERNDGFEPLTFIRRLPVLLRLNWRHRKTGDEIETLLPQIAQWTAEFAERREFTDSDGALWAEANVWVRRMTHALDLQNEMSGRSLMYLALLESLLTRWCGRGELAPALVSGLSDVESAKIGAALADLARTISDADLTPLVLEQSPEVALRQLREDPRAAAVMRSLAEFIKKHGHRTANESEWLHPRWADAPSDVIGLALAYLRAGALPDPAASGREQSRRREEVKKWVQIRLDPVRGAIFHGVLSRAQRAVRLRDNGKSGAVRLSYPAHRIVNTFGLRWSRRGWLVQAEDIFFLTMPDIERVIMAGSPSAAGMDLMRLVASRRLAHAHWFTVEPPEAVGPNGMPVARASRGRAADRAETAGSGNAAALDVGMILRGIPASAGRARGTVRVIHNPTVAMRIRPGDILVTRATDAGWSAVFPVLGALVTEVGGQLSHAAIVAREYGLPAVVNVAEATTAMCDGDIVMVDGSAGTVTVEVSAARQELAAEGAAQ
jgi:rifampicin phosphotransferase